ncbi:MAG: hypothetical protein ACKPKO_27025, partial [Candidatus Fonsibacter sp.]
MTRQSKTSNNSSTSYTVEPDLEIPPDLHNKFKEYSPAIQTIAPDASWFSDFQTDLAERHGIVKDDESQGSNKLIPHLYKHKKYVIHYHNLKYMHQLGVKNTKNTPEDLIQSEGLDKNVYRVQQHRAQN